MKTVSATYKGNRMLELKVDIPLEEDANVFVIVPDEDDREESIWDLFVTQGFADGYAESDAVYDTL